jgi:hypothetical protein
MAKVPIVSKIIEHTDTLPATINADGKALLDYRVYGNTGGVGDKTVNYFDAEISVGNIDNTSGADDDTTNVRLRSGFLSTALFAGVYTINASGIDEVVIYKYDAEKNFIGTETSPSYWGALPRTVTLSSVMFVRFVFRHSDNRRCYVSDISNIMFTPGATPPETFVPFGYKLPMIVSDGYQIYDDTLPAQISANGMNFKNYRIFGAVGGVGDRTVQLFDKNATDTDNGYVSGAYIRSDGTTSVSVHWMITEYIEINQNENYTLDKLNGGVAAYCLYDSTKNYISGSNYNEESTITFNSGNAKYIRFSVVINPELSAYNLDVLTFTEGTTPPETFVPFGYEVDISIKPENLWNITAEDFENSSIISGAAKGFVITGLIPNTEYTLSSNIPRKTDAANLWFNGGSTVNNGVWDGNSRTSTSNENGEVIVYYHETELTNYGEYWYQLNEGSIFNTVTPIYIGDIQLEKDEYVDYQTGKIYRKKQVHTDTVTIDGIVWDILGYDHDTVYKSDNTLAQHSVTIQVHDALSDMQFDAKEALFAFDNGLSAGTYHFTVGEQPWYSGDANKSIQFTLAQALPSGGQLVINNAYNATMIGATISAFASGTATTATETVTMSEGSDGTDLGTVTNGLSQDGVINSIQRALLGSDKWSESCIRQYLNSSASAGSVWEPKNKWDRPPSWAANTAGFLNGMSADFIANLGTTSKTTALNTVTDGGDTGTTLDKMFLLSRSEVYGGDEVSGGDGTPYLYYANYSSLSEAGTGNDSNRIKYRNDVTKIWWLRSPFVGNAISVRIVGTSSAIGDSGATNTRGVAPACCIPLDDIETNTWLREKFLKPVDPPAPLPVLSTCEGTTIVNYEGKSNVPSRFYGTYINSPIIIPIYIGSDPLEKVGDYANYIDYEKQKIIKKMKKYVLTGDEGWYTQGGTTVPSENIYFRLQIAPLNYLSTTTNICSHFNKEDIAIANSIVGYRFYHTSASNADTLNIRPQNVSTTTLSDFKTWLAEQYAAGTPVTIWVGLTTPEETDPPVALPALPTCEGTTVLDYNGTPVPSEMYIKYRSWSSRKDCAVKKYHISKNLYDGAVEQGGWSAMPVPGGSAEKYDIDIRCRIDKIVPVDSTTKYRATVFPNTLKIVCFYFDEQGKVIGDTSWSEDNSNEIPIGSYSVVCTIKNQEETAIVPSDIQGIMITEGTDIPTEFDPYGKWWEDCVLRVLEVRTDTFATLPATINVNGNALIDYRIYGNTGGVGDKTVNLFNKNATDTTNGYVSGGYLTANGEITSNGNWSISEYIEIDQNKNYVLNNLSADAAYCLYDNAKDYISGTKYNRQSTITFNSGDAKYIRFSVVTKSTLPLYNLDILTLTPDTTPPETYVPYGYEVDMGVKSAQLFDKNATDTTNGYVSGKFLMSDNTTSTNSNWMITEYIEINQNENYTLDKLNGTNAAYCLYDSTKNYISGAKYNDELTITFNSGNAKYIRFSVVINPNISAYNLDVLTFTEGTTPPDKYQPYSSTTTPIYIGDEPLEKDEYVDYAEQKVYRRTANLFDKNATDTTNGYVSGAYIKSNGELQNSSAWFVSEYISVNAEEQYTVVYGSQASSRAICYYDIDRNYISGANYSGLSTQETITTPVTCAYIRLSLVLDAEDVITVTPGTTPPETYIPYYRPTDPPIPLPEISTFSNTNTVLDYDGTPAPSFVVATYKGWFKHS